MKHYDNAEYLRRFQKWLLPFHSCLTRTLVKGLCGCQQVATGRAQDALTDELGPQHKHHFVCFYFSCNCYLWNRFPSFLFLYFSSIFLNHFSLGKVWVSLRSVELREMAWAQLTGVLCSLPVSLEEEGRHWHGMAAYSLWGQISQNHIQVFKWVTSPSLSRVLKKQSGVVNIAPCFKLSGLHIGWACSN